VNQLLSHCDIFELGHHNFLHRTIRIRQLNFFRKRTQGRKHTIKHQQALARPTRLGQEGNVTAPTLLEDTVVDVRSH
jgi:hypothetical protein